MKDTLENMFAIGFYGGLLFWLGYSIYEYGFTEPVLWVIGALVCLALSFMAFASASMELSGGISSMFINFIIWSVFAGAAAFRFCQWVLGETIARFP